MIPCRLLKELSVELAPILTAIFRQSINEGELPSDWKEANVAPIFKKGQRNLAINYRPVSLTCVCSKLLEHIISSHIRQHLDDNGILSNLQHGFRKFFSCETQLLITLQDLFSFREQKTQVDMAILDFSKAFDKVPHRRLLGKLSHYGIQGPVLRWIEAFLIDREQRVVVDGHASAPCKVMSGVPQGTVLGPLLFLLFINDLPSVVDSQVRLFADDCLMYRPVYSVEDQVSLQRDLASLERWGDAWGMHFNANKCQIMSITRGKSHLIYFYSLSGHFLESVQEAKYLGITLSNSLSWSPHVDLTYNRANSTLGFLRRNLRRCPSKLKETAYITLIRTVMEYAAPIWDPVLSKDIHRLESVQRRAARFIKGDWRTTSSVTAMLRDLGLKDLQSRRRDLRLALMFKLVHGHIGVTPDEMSLQPADSRTRSNHRFKFKLNHNRQSFLGRTVREWNDLPSDLVELASPDIFKGSLPSFAPTCAP